MSIRHGLPSVVSGLLAAIQPIATALLAPSLLGERISLKQWCGIVLGFAGVSLVLEPKLFHVSLDQLEANLTLVGINAVGMIGVTIGSFYQKRFIPTGDLRSVSVLQYIGALAFLLPLAYALEPMQIEWTGTMVVVMAWSVLALTLYGDLDVSVIRDLPPGRLPIKTIAKPESRRDEIYAFVGEQIAAGRQAYVIFPLVEESDKVDLKAATEMAEHLQHEVFPSRRAGLLHGRMKNDVKDQVMKAFAAGEIDILVSTTVVEVGVDVPNASVIVVEHAERFGLSQLHQLRGRVGRGAHQSFCCLVYQAPLSEDGRGRLKAMTDTTDGFEIADRDLQLRGPGDFFGTRQAGVPTFRLIDLVRDRELLADAQREAATVLEGTRPSAAGLQGLMDRWATRFRLIEVA